MEKILKIAELLGEENAQKIKNEISEFEDVRREVFANVRSKMVAKYTAEIEKKFEELF